MIAEGAVLLRTLSIRAALLVLEPFTHGNTSTRSVTTPAQIALSRFSRRLGHGEDSPRYRA